MAWDSYDLPSLWQDYHHWWAGEEGDPEESKQSIQDWSNVESYLHENHGLPHAGFDKTVRTSVGGEDWDRYYEHPATVAMAKLHSLAQGKNFFDDDPSHQTFSDDEVLQGAALGLLKIRRNQHNQIRTENGLYPTASTDGVRYAHLVEADVADDLTRMRLAAVTQDLVDRLGGEFHDWAEANNVTNPYLRDDIEQGRGPIGHWPSIERFLKENYPAAHRGLEMGSEEARPMLDQPSDQTHAPLWGKERYETGPDAIARHGYDPKEVAASMLLLHNQSHPFRGDLAQEDQDRLNGIAQKRFQMQRQYEQRTKTAMPAPLPAPHKDSWEPGEQAHYEYHCLQSPDSSDYHLWQRSHQPVQVLGPSPNAEDFSDEYPTLKERGDEGVPKLYRVKFGDGHEDDAWEDELLTHPGHFQTSHAPPRLAMPMPLPKGTYFRYHPELVWSPGVTAHAPGGKMVGSLEWYDDDHVMVDLGTRRPGEIDRIQVPEDHRGQSIATSMFDFAKQHEPRLHHSDQLTEDGRGWSQYEQSRNA